MSPGGTFSWTEKRRAKVWVRLRKKRKKRGKGLMG